jgi:hypothetical protein
LLVVAFILLEFVPTHNQPSEHAFEFCTAPTPAYTVYMYCTASPQFDHSEQIPAAETAGKKLVLLET